MLWVSRAGDVAVPVSREPIMAWPSREWHSHTLTK
jgi:hypothetical protein